MPDTVVLHVSNPSIDAGGQSPKLTVTVPCRDSAAGPKWDDYQIVARAGLVGTACRQPGLYGTLCARELIARRSEKGDGARGGHGRMEAVTLDEETFQDWLRGRTHVDVGVDLHHRSIGWERWDRCE